MKPRTKREKALYQRGLEVGLASRESTLDGLRAEIARIKVDTSQQRIDAMVKLANSVGQALDAQSKMLYGLGQTFDNLR